MGILILAGVAGGRGSGEKQNMVDAKSKARFQFSNSVMKCS